MARSQRRIDPDKQLAHLQRRHARLKDEVRGYEERLSLTPPEQMDLQRLKKQKLECKDQMRRIRE